MSSRRGVEPDWRDQAECRFDPDLWFEKTSEAVAKEICATTCTVREQCLAYALANGEQFGVHGGLSPDELAQTPGFVRAASANDFAPEPDDTRIARYTRLDQRKRAAATVPDPLADLHHPSDRKNHTP